MSKYVENVLQTLGSTPMVRLNKIVGGLLPTIFAKIEFMNPGGSVKDRVALAMIEEAEQNGQLLPGGTIIEATSGNTGVGLAMVAAVKGYRSIFIMPDKMSDEKIRLLKAYGAEVVITPTSAETNSPEGYGGVAKRLLNEIPNSWQPDQFANLANPQCHYETTGPEIWEQTGGKIRCFVAGIGTGGTISGVGRFLKEKDETIKVIGADPEGSIISGDKPRPWDVEGIGEDFVPTTLNPQVVDEWIRVSDQDSFATARALARQEGLLVGGSTGTAVAAALKYAQRLGSEDIIVALCPDTGRNYLSKLYNDDWMAEHGYMVPRTEPRTIGELIAARESRELLTVTPDAVADTALQMLREHGISQIPVVENGKLVGCIREITIARMLHSGDQPQKVPIREIMARPMPQVDEQVEVDEVYRLLLSGNSGVVVTKKGKIREIVTRIDLVDFWDRKTVETA